MIMFCAMICASKMPRNSISARAQTSSAKATGMPSAMAPQSEARKTRIVIYSMPCRVWAARSSWYSPAKIRSSASESRPLASRHSRTATMMPIPTEVK